MIFLLSAGGLAAQDAVTDTSVHFARAEDGLVRGLDAIGTWQMTRSPDLIVMQCTDCSAPVTVVVRYIEDYTGGTDFVGAQAYYDAGRRQFCSALVAEGKGRCIGGGTSLEGGMRTYEFVIPEGPHLLAGYVTTPDGTAEHSAAVEVMRDAVRRLSPLW